MMKEKSIENARHDLRRKEDITVPETELVSGVQGELFKLDPAENERVAEKLAEEQPPGIRRHQNPE